tara:strand:+ start:42 stop:494 length:453 start_codon:yes stop_codon:yes gene_type:complete
MIDTDKYIEDFSIKLGSYLSDLVNHTIAKEKFIDADSSKQHWSIHTGEESIHLKIEDSDNPVKIEYDKMMKTLSSYPLLDEHAFASAEYKCMAVAVAQRLLRLGTIISLCMEEAVRVLIENDISMIETGPARYSIICSDDVFTEILTRGE